MPGPYWFFFQSFDCNEPPHVHVRATGSTPGFGWRPWH